VATLSYKRKRKKRKRVRVSKEAMKEAKFTKYDIANKFSKYLYEPLTNNTLDSIAGTAKELYTGGTGGNYLWTPDASNTVTFSSGKVDYVTYDDKWKWTDDSTDWSYTNPYLEYTTNKTAATNDAQYIYRIDDSEDYITVDYQWGGDVTIKLPLSPEEQKRQQIIDRLRQNLAPQILVKRFGLGNARKPSEAKAREALLSIIGSHRFRRYLKNGFVSIRGKSGRIYQIFPGHKHTKVWFNGVHIEDLCVIMVDSSLPPSDSVIMRMLMILDSEEEFRQVANVTPRNPMPMVAAA
jgi:hypothetical protein